MSLSDSWIELVLFLFLQGRGRQAQRRLRNLERAYVAPPVAAPVPAPAPPSTPDQQTLLRLYAAMRSKRGMIEVAVRDIEAAEALARDTGVCRARSAMRTMQEEVLRLLRDRERIQGEIDQLRSDMARQGDDPGEPHQDEAPRLPASLIRRLSFEARRD